MRYELETKTHGAGGFGKIFRGHDTVLDRDVAVKEMSGFGATFEPAEMERFQREARILAKIFHPSIPAIYDVISDVKGGSFQIIFQFYYTAPLRRVHVSSIRHLSPREE